MNFQGFVGPTYNLKSVNVDAQRCVNLFPEVIESGTGKEAQVAFLKSTPGLENILEVGPGPIRLVHFDDPPINTHNPTTRIFVASGNKMYKVIYSAGAWSATEIGTLTTSSGPIKAVSVQFNLGATVFVDGTDTYLYWKYSTGDALIIETFDLFAAYGYPTAPNATHVVLIDGYFIFNSANTNQFYVSDWNSLTIDPLNFASAEGDPDNIEAIISNNRELWVFNERTTEVYVNTGNADFPFERVQGGFIEKGCLAKYSVAKIDGTVFWLGRDEFGQGIVYSSKGLTPQRISTHAVEFAIKNYENNRAANGFTYQSDGHSFYVLNFDEGTWVYDLSTNLWHERAFTNSGALERHRANYHSFIPEFGIHMVGDYSNNKIYQFDDDKFTDDGTEITRMRVAPHVSSGLQRLFCSRFQIDMETGVGLDGSSLGSDPKVIMDFSDDGGHTYSNEAWVSAGKSVGGIGEYKTRVIWRRLGQFRDRIFRIKITDPVKVTILSAELEIHGEG